LVVSSPHIPPVYTNHRWDMRRWNYQEHT
jgi:hypothetical protein